MKTLQRSESLPFIYAILSHAVLPEWMRIKNNYTDPHMFNSHQIPDKTHYSKLLNMILIDHRKGTFS